MGRRKTMILCAAVLATACGGGGSGSGQPCGPPGFTACEGDKLVTCVGVMGADAGMTQIHDCTMDGLVCTGALSSAAACGPAMTGQPCMSKNELACGAGGDVLRCVWLSEQPEPGYSGNLGIWRQQTACSDMGQMCASPHGKATCVSG